MHQVIMVLISNTHQKIQVTQIQEKAVKSILKMASQFNFSDRRGAYFSPFDASDLHPIRSKSIDALISFETLINHAIKFLYQSLFYNCI